VTGEHRLINRTPTDDSWPEAVPTAPLQTPNYVVLAEVTRTAIDIGDHLATSASSDATEALADAFAVLGLALRAEHVSLWVHPGAVGDEVETPPIRYVAGWAREMFVESQLPRATVTIDGDGLMVGVLCDAEPFVFPIVLGGRLHGALCVGLGSDTIWDPGVLAELDRLAGIIGQFEGRTRVERMLDEKSRFSDFLSRLSERFFELVPGDEEEAFHDALSELGRLLNATSIGFWESVGDATVPPHQHHWAAATMASPEVAAHRIPEPNPAPVPFDELNEPMVLGQNQLSSQDDADLGWLVAPGKRAGETKSVIVVSRFSVRPWQDWEVDGVCRFGKLVSVARHRLAHEALLVATFEQAPSGIMLMSETGLLRDCNQAVVDFLGLKSEFEMLGLPSRDWLATDVASDVVVDLLRQPRATGAVEVPFRHQDGGVVWARVSVAELRDSTAVSWLAHVIDITNERQVRLEIDTRARVDAVTGLANRHECLQRLAALRRDGAGVCGLLLFDLDRFKSVNDSFGHQTGDDLLAAIGRRVQANTVDGEFAGRWGGDEFVVICAGVVGQADLDAAITRLRASFEDPFVVNGHRFDVTVSIGGALGDATDDVLDLVARADEAMYAEKVRS